MKMHTLTYSTRSYQRLQFIVPIGTSNVSVLSEFVNDVSEMYWVVQNTSADGFYDYGGRDSVRSIRLALNGSDVLVPEIGTGQYLRVVQALQHHVRVPTNYYYMYSFVCPVNMTHITRQEHTINLIENGYERRLTLYAKSLNEFRVGHGIGHMRDKMRESGSLVSSSVGSGYNIVSTFSGYAASYSYNDGIGTSARLLQPNDITYDGQGNLFFSEETSSTIRKLVIATGEVTTIAGLAGSFGSADGVGSAARFNQPAGIVYVSGNLYICDRYNHTIRKLVISTGQVTTIAGLAGSGGSADGVGANARFLRPFGLAYDGLGNLYICDESNHTIRKLVISTSAVTTIAGLARSSGSDDGVGSAARFYYPERIVYVSGNLYICDTGNSTIRKLVISTSEVTTIAGSAGSSGTVDGIGSAAGFTGPRGITYDGQGNLFICENIAIRKLVISSGLVITVTGGVYGANANIGPRGIVYYGQGIFYICDFENCNIKKLDILTYELSIIAGGLDIYGIIDGISNLGTYKNTQSIVYDGNGNMFVSDDMTIRKLNIYNAHLTTFAGTVTESYIGISIDGNGTNARFNYIETMAYDGQGNLFISDNNTIRKLVISSGAVTTIAGFAGSSGSADGVGTTARFVRPFGLTYDGNGNLFISDNNTVRKMVISTSAVTTIAGTAGNDGSDDGIGSAARFYGPWGIVYVSGNLYICDAENHTIRKMVIATQAVTTIAGLAGSSGSADGVGSDARFNKPYGITYDGQGNLFICDFENYTIRKLVISTSAVTTIAGTPGTRGFNDGTSSSATFIGPVSCGYDEAGSLFIADLFGIRKIIL
jgi:streptogramin lyase